MILADGVTKYLHISVVGTVVIETIGVREGVRREGTNFSSILKPHSMTDVTP